MEDNIILIGFMGVGKGRTARALADATGRFALDTDDLIESRTKKKIRHIFSEQGEPAFRSLEYQVGLWLEQSVKGSIISTGGGFFQVDNISRLGKVVYLHAEVESIIESIMNHPKAEKKIKKRPLLQDIEKAEQLFQSRLSGYRAAADFEVNVQGCSPIEVAEKVMVVTGIYGGAYE